MSTITALPAEKDFTITVPKEYHKRDIHLKIHDDKKIDKIQTYRSFAINTKDNRIVVNDKKIHLQHLFMILKKHGLSETLPVNVTLTHPISFNSFDWQPQSYQGPTIWYFDWNSVKCSITGSVSMQLIYIRVHDLTPGLGESILDELTTELLKFWINPVPNKSIIIYTSQKAYGQSRWVQSCTRLCRSMDTIYINPQIKSYLIDQLNKFLTSSHIYDRYGITWKRVYLFHGPPGTGKSSTILALASIFEKNLAKFTITPDLTGQDIELLFQLVPDESFVLLEDADALFTERKSNTSIDFSTLLNCMDGIATKRGLVLFMTTNHLLELDTAFIRPGRVDYTLEFTYPTRAELYQALSILGADYPVHEHDEFINNNPNITITDLQKHLFDCIMNEKKSMLV